MKPCVLQISHVVLSEISYTGIWNFKKSRVALMLRIKRLHDVLLCFLQASDMPLGCYQLQTGHRIPRFLPIQHAYSRESVFQKIISR